MNTHMTGISTEGNKMNGLYHRHHVFEFGNSLYDIDNNMIELLNISDEDFIIVSLTSTSNSRKLKNMSSEKAGHRLYEMANQTKRKIMEMRRKKESESLFSHTPIHLTNTSFGRRVHSLGRKNYSIKQPFDKEIVDDSRRNFCYIPKCSSHKLLTTTPSVQRTSFDVKKYFNGNNSIPKHKLSFDSSLSEIAGHRLYQLAIESRVRLDKLRKERERADAKHRKLVVATRPRRRLLVASSSSTVSTASYSASDDSSASTCTVTSNSLQLTSVKAGHRLHNLAAETEQKLKELRYRRDLGISQICKLRIATRNTCRESRRKSSGDSRNNRLYNLSKPLQDEGKKKRQDIQRRKEESKKLPDYFTKKISLYKADLLYERLAKRGPTPE